MWSLQWWKKLGLTLSSASDRASRISCVVLRIWLTVSEMHESKRTAECPCTNLKHKIFSLPHDLHILSRVGVHEDLHYYQKQLWIYFVRAGKGKRHLIFPGYVLCLSVVRTSQSLKPSWKAGTREKEFGIEGEPSPDIVLDPLYFTPYPVLGLSPLHLVSLNRRRWLRNMSPTPPNIFWVPTHIFNYLPDISTWMSQNHLKINMSPGQLISFPLKANSP